MDKNNKKGGNSSKECHGSTSRPNISDSGPNASRRVVHLDDPDLNTEEVLFNPMIEVRLPCPEAPVFNNLSEYVNKTLGSKAKKAGEDPAVLKEKAEKLKQDCSAPVVRLAKRKEPEPDASTSSSQSKVVLPNEKSPGVDGANNSRRNISILEKMLTYTVGPYSTLFKSLNCPIRVMIRRRKKCPTKNERFSNVNGTLVAFDKHFNILLKNVNEIYEHTIPKSNKIIKIVRNSHQLMIRGDNVIIVSKI